jgi:hypothetical protein
MVELALLFSKLCTGNEGFFNHTDQFSVLLGVAPSAPSAPSTPHPRTHVLRNSRERPCIGALPITTR